VSPLSLYINEVNVMNVIEKLQEKIDQEKESKERAIVFWYDPQAQVDLKELSEQLKHIEVRQLTDKNCFKLKYEMEISRPTTSFLLYAEHARPQDKDNMLLDILSYSAEFKADEVAMLAETLQVSDYILRPIMEQYPLFFENKDRRKRLGKLLPSDTDRHHFELSMVAVLVKAPVPDIRVITRQLLLNGLSEEENEYVRQLKRNYSFERALETIGRYFGVWLEPDHEPLEHLMSSLIYQHFRQHATFTVEEWESDWASSSPNVCALFVEEWLRQGGDVIDETIKGWEKTNHVREVLSSFDVDAYQNVETFPVVDALIIEKCIDELTHQTIDKDKRMALIEQRLTMYWGSKGKLKALYLTLLKAVQLHDLKQMMNRPTHQDDLYERYATDLYQVDQVYRHFIYHYSILDTKEMFEDIADRFTNWYEHEYLRQLSEETNASLEEGDTPNIMPQRLFFKKTIQPILDKEQTRVFVIISDALRYEAAYELHEHLKGRENGKSEIQPMAASYPTYTQLGMASLLPHTELMIDETRGVLADGQSTKGLANRLKVLKEIEPQTEVLKLKALLDMKASEAEQILRGKRLVYLYHDHIDALGDSAKSERETYGAVNQAIEDLKYAVDRLSRLQAKRIFVTADHGFLFQFKQIENHGKISAVEGKVIDQNRRFAIGHQLSTPEGAIKLSEIQTPLKNVEVVLAKSMNRFKTGGGLQFIHGGALPQEAVVPLIDYRRIEKAEPVDIAVAMVNKVITNYRMPVTFYQDQSVSDDYTSRKVAVAFYQGNERISNLIELVFDSSGEKQARNRQVVFNLVEKHYRIDEKAILRVETVTKKGKEVYIEEEFTLRIYEALY